MVQGLEDEDGGAVAHHEALPVRVEREGGVFGIRGAGKGLRVGEAGHADRNGGVLGAAGDDGVGIAVPDGAVRLAEAVRRSGAGRDDVQARALRLVLDGDMAGRDVGDHRRDEQRGDPLAGGILDHLGRLPVLDLEAADAGAHIDAQAERVDVHLLAFSLQAGSLHGLPGRRHGELGELVLLADKGLVHIVLLRIEILHFAGDRDGHVLEVFDIVDAADAVHEVLPIGIEVISHGGNDAHAGDNNSFRFHNFSTTDCKYTNYSAITTPPGRPPSGAPRRMR